MAEPSKILLFLPNWVGDVVMATAAMRSIRLTHPKARIVGLLRPYVGDVLDGAGLCDEFIRWPANGAGGAEGGAVSLIRRLRNERFDLAVLFTNSFRTALIACLAGIARRVGYSREARGWLLTDRLQPAREGGKYKPIPALDYYNDLARSVGCSQVDDQLVLATSARDEAEVEKRLGPFDPRRRLVTLNPGANFGPAKCWPPRHYAEVARELARRFDARVVASFAANETSLAEELRAVAGGAVEVLCDPPLGLGPLKALVKRSALLVTNDTGPRHFAAAFGVPAVTVFGSSDPAWTDTRYARERWIHLKLDCQPCMQRTCPLKHHACMNDLTPDRVLAAALELLK